MKILAFATHRPVGFILVLTIVWVVLFLVFMGAASTILQKPYGGAMTVSIGRLAVTTCVIFLAWQLDWLKASGISRLGGWQVWLLALGGLVYVASASLYSFYGSVAFDFPSVLQLPDARTAAITHFIAGLSEEILFRGLVLYALIRVWENLTQGILGSVLLAAALFAFVVSTWWGALAVMGAAYGRQRSNISWSMRSWLCKA